MCELNGRLYLSTIADDACELAARYGLGLEIAEYCTASNMDENFGPTDRQVRVEMRAARRFVFHAPFNELCPAAIDPLAVELAGKRYRQAVAVARGYGIRRLVVHSGYIPLVYYPSWFLERSAVFWRDFLKDFPRDMELCLENVMEEGPEQMTDLARAVDDPRFRLCLDVGHANAELSHVPVPVWAEKFAPWLSHVHLHNNEGGRDLHAALGDGTAPVRETIGTVERLCPAATYTIENMHAAPSVQWLMENGFLKV